MTAWDAAGRSPNAEPKPPFVVTLARAFRPRDGWVVFVLTISAVLTLPITVSSNRLIAGLAPAIPLAMLGFLMGWWVGGRRISGLLSALLLSVAGVFSGLVWGVHVVMFRPLFQQAATWLNWWARPVQLVDQSYVEALFAARDIPAPPITYFADQWAALLGFGQRVGWWVTGLAVGQGEGDNLVLVWFGVLIAWCVAAWAGWWMARRGRPFVALAPTGLLLCQQVYAANTGHYALLTFLGVSTALLVMGHLARRVRSWEAAGADYSPEIRLDAALIAGALAVAAVVFSPTLPFITSGELSRQFWKLFEQPYRDMETRFSGSFQGTRPGRSLVPAAGVAAGGLPRAHLLGGNPDLGKEVALRVRTRGARDGEPLYWRGQTFAHYDGRGWSDPEETVRELDLAAGEPWQTSGRLIEQRSVLSRVEVAAASRAVLYSAGEPISVDRPYQAITRGAGELIALRSKGGPRRYNVLGRMIDQDPDLLRQAGDQYPGGEQFTRLYLQLPEKLSPRLVQYVAEVTQGAETPYDRALAIEAALREFPYSLDVPPPPAGQEIVSWFLFEQREGYCDYYATAMVVLARLAGIPARLAVGYATGNYERENERYVVTELSAHSWPELYFPSVGWVPFEPTAARVTPERIASGGEIPAWMRMPDSLGMESGLSALREEAEIERRAGIVTQSARWSLFALSLLFSLLVMRRWFGPASQAAPESLSWLFERLMQGARRLGVRILPTDTPRDVGRSLVTAANVRAQSATWQKSAAEDAASLVRREAERLAVAYEKATYAPDATETLVAHYAESRDWGPLWSAIRRLRWVRRRPG